MQHPHTIRQIESKLNRLRPSERKVADYVLANTEQVIQMRIVDLAKLNKRLQSLRTEQ